ncbi:MAG: CerR family C-terminal domain-containing protein [Planctomycetes bacterium]|nr:CerR family C-terminal domain-containing protein [Planctomycetota bacterium]
MIKTNTSPPSDIGQATRDRLLSAAGQIFADHGFQNATVRDICSRAGANIAAINYHFGDKQGLYSEVFLYACSLAADNDTAKADSGLPAPERLRRHISAFLAHLLDEGRPAWHSKLMARELVEPTGVLDDLIGHSIRPHFQGLIDIVSAILGPTVPADVVQRCATSIVGQCVFFHNSRPILVRLDPELRFGHDQIEALAAHITTFSLTGLTAFMPAREVRKSAAALKRANHA